jgi:hypothetical protein
MSEVLRPGVQHGERPDPGAEVTGIGGDLQQGLGCCAKQQVIKQAWVPECERSQLLRAQ